MTPRYPVYIISKGRAKTPLTVDTLKEMKVPFKLVIEPQEYDEYKHLTDDIILLPFSNLGQGSIPARNFVWEHAIKTGAERHWIMDDNIRHFFTLNYNKKTRVKDGSVICHMEDFTDRYENVAISGPNYHYFCKATEPVPPYYLNTRVYSCILIKNNLPYRWRGKYNEDTDLSLRVLKDGWCTVLFNAFLSGKVATMTMKGGNTDNVYIDGDNRLKFAQALAELHPDVAKVTWKFGRWHHSVDYRAFQKTNQLIKKSYATTTNAGD